MLKIDNFLAAKPELVGAMNSLSELGEKLYISSSQEGRDLIRGQLGDIQQVTILLILMLIWYMFFFFGMLYP
jgi:hypothetical protein